MLNHKVFRKLNGETMRKRAFYKDIRKTLKNNLSRFIAIVVMTALGTGVFTGFAAGCMDVFESADRFYDKQNTYDIKIASTLGLTEEDLSAVSGVEKVKSVFGNNSMDVMMTQTDGNLLLANLTTLDKDGINNPYVLEGTLPTSSGQIAVNSKFVDDTGLQIGDSITLEKVNTEEESNTSNTVKKANKAEEADKTDEAIKTEEADTTEEADKAEEVDTTDEENKKEEANKAETSITIEETDIEESTEVNTPSLAVTEYVITAIILSPLDISNAEASMASISFSTSSTDYMMYATKECIDSDIYSSVYITINGTEELDCYSTEYQSLVDNTSAIIKATILEDRQQARYDEIVGSSNSKIAESEELLAVKITEAEQKLSDAQKEIDDGWRSVNDGWVELQTNKAKLADGEQALKNAQKSTDEEFRAAQKEIDDNLSEINAGEKKLNIQEKSALKEFAAYEQQLTNNQNELDTQKSEAELQLNGTVNALSAEGQKIWNSEATKLVWVDMISDGKKAAPYLLAVKQGKKPTEEQTASYNKAMAMLQTDTQALAVCFATEGHPLTEEQITTFSTLAVTSGTLNYSQTLLDENSTVLATQKADALDQITESRQKIEDGKAQLTSGQKKLDKNMAIAKKQFTDKQVDLKEGKQKLADAQKDLKEAEAELIDGQSELDDNKSDYENSITTARQKLDNAKEEVANISMTKWYVWDRYDNDSFAGLDNDISFIQAVTKAFPIIFFLVAILICLTTMTRMVEEDRALIGTYKSLGYSKIQISLKYILYAVLACIAGGILGNGIGFFVLPKVISIIVSSLYVLPTFKLSFYPIYGLGGFGLFLLGIVGATVISCAELLHKRPAELMRPKAPKEGSRILLERIPFIWKRLNFLNKVTCRNLFRYKKRALMTIVGILGCMMLIVLGFGMSDTVGGLMSDQFDKVTVYDAIVVTDNLNPEEMDLLDNEMKASGMVNDAVQLQITTLTLWSSSANVDITVMVIPDGTDLQPYVHLSDSVTHKKMSLPSDGIVVTQNAAKKLKLKIGDTASLQNEDNLEYDFPVAFVTTNNAGNYVYISESCYQEAFGDYTGTSFLMNMTDNINVQKWLDNLGEDDRILTVSSSQDARDTFEDVKKIVNMVVYLLISMSAVLALTVLFTLSNINVSERERELATMKVLGFKPKEVNSYVNKETFILTLLGILLGMPAGYGITYAILANVSIANTAFNVRVSMVEALKSVE
ncbi:MAG: transporter permease [Herbinix sp.]|nr:transporter permease [Herbinix sp.]